MTADSFGFGDCQAGTERGWPCSQAAVNDSGLCRWHMKVKFRIAFPYKPEVKVSTTKKTTK